jgi:hypothetical protein
MCGFSLIRQTSEYEDFLPVDLRNYQSGFGMSPAPTFAQATTGAATGQTMDLAGTPGRTSGVAWNGTGS